jgi:hypothetical protein
VQQGYIDEAALVVSDGMLVFVIAYLMIRPTRGDAPGAEGLAAVAARVLDWRLIALACAPLAVLTYEGRGYINGTLSTGAGAPVTYSLAAEFFVILVVLAAFSFVLCHGPQSFLPTLVAQSVLLAAAGERTPLITDAIMLILLLCHDGVRPPAAQVHAAAALTVAAILAITGLRAGHGRSVSHSDSGLNARATALGGALATQPGTRRSATSLAAQAAERLDGVAFAGAVLQAAGRMHGAAPLGRRRHPESLLLAVPRAAWSSKLTHARRPEPGPDGDRRLRAAEGHLPADSSRPVHGLPGRAVAPRVSGGYRRGLQTGRAVAIPPPDPGAAGTAGRGDNSRAPLRGRASRDARGPARGCRHRGDCMAGRAGAA